MSSLPLLPGYRLNKKPQTAFAKTHMFDLKNGQQTEAGPIDNESVSVVYPGEFEDAVTTNNARTDINGVLSSVPSWVQYDRKVLRFYCYYKEAIFSSAFETFRNRNCVLYYYLEDDTIHVAETKQENSGMPQGDVIKRHRIPKEDNSLVTIQDLDVGQSLKLYGRTFFMYDADNFTRQFYLDHGTTLGPSVEIPKDNFAAVTAPDYKNHNKLMHPMKQHMEATLGKQMGLEIAKTQQFLANDRKVLRFYIRHNDKTLYGEPRAFVMQYYLADDTVSIGEVKDQNNSRDHFATLLKRCRLPINVEDLTSEVSVIGVQDEGINFYTAADFRIGGTVNVYGRVLDILGCDPFTEEYYKTNFNRTDADFPKDLLTSMDIPEQAHYITAPEPMGYGTEEDSLGSFVYLNPKIPKTDYRKLLENEGILLRWLAKFKTPSELDEERTFIITYYMATDTVQVFENFQRNSGFIGGKFLERSKQVNVLTGKYFHPRDFQIGGECVINDYEFRITDMDLYTKKFLANNPELVA